MGKKAIVLFSGGLDSTASLYWALNYYDELLLLSFLYGSKEDEAIKKTNEYFASRLKIESKIITLDFFKEIIKQSSSTLVSEGKNVPIFEEFKDLNNLSVTEQTAKSVWVPARNLLFISIASAIADSFNQPVDIVFGANEEEGVTFLDNTPEFVNRMNEAIKYGCTNSISVKAPFAKSNKKQIIKYLTEQNAEIAFSSSCYELKGWTEEGKPIHCGRCESCMRRKRAFLQAKVSDPTIYKENS
ncbi:MAG: 7-cyano-7-deazaguanine synthase [Candidatus Heimdallarchaeaceae archaeon]